VEAQAPRFSDPLAVIADAYANGTTDEFILPAVVGDYRGLRDGDGVLCSNFRADRVREILAAILDPGFSGFSRGRRVQIAAAAGMTHYSEKLGPFIQAIFPLQVADAGRTQLRMAETEKYPHVTYFPNGGREVRYRGEDRVMVPSPKVATYDLKPEMSAPELTDKAVGAVGSGKYDLIVLSYANPDMVGHTGNLSAATKAVETVADAIASLELRFGFLLWPLSLARKAERTRYLHPIHRQPLMHVRRLIIAKFAICPRKTRQRLV
jgi:2,3-bisphosphoglycerate-independent phosphoglycerate mutase